MSKRRETKDKRCPKCHINNELCFCSILNKSPNQTKISLIIHFKEKPLTSNTALLAYHSLENCEYFYRGERGVTLSDSFVIDQNYSPLYLYPSEDAQELTTDFISKIKKPIQLIIPDGTWRQAAKFHKREEVLKGIPHVKLPPLPPSIYELRKQKYQNGLCTLEAIAHALGIIESQDLSKKLLDVLKVMNQRAKLSRTMPFDQILSIPEDLS